MFERVFARRCHRNGFVELGTDAAAVRASSANASGGGAGGAGGAGVPAIDGPPSAGRATAPPGGPEACTDSSELKMSANGAPGARDAGWGAMPMRPRSAASAPAGGAGGVYAAGSPSPKEGFVKEEKPVGIPDSGEA